MIRISNTPNPLSLKFIVPEKWMNFVWECADESTAKKSVLASKLWQIEGVKYLLFGHDFVSVTKSQEALWEIIQLEIIEAIADFLNDVIGQGKDFFAKEIDAAQLEQAKKVAQKWAENSIEEKIQHVLEEKVQPAIAHHGGFIKLIGFENGIVKLDLQGACKGCPSSTQTLKFGIQNLLQYYFPEVVSVESVE
jgi:Fe-S cluster biogenesis protein NfuA